MKLASPQYSVQITPYDSYGNRIGDMKVCKNDLSGKQYGGRMGASFIRSYQDGTGVRWYELSESDGRRWHGPMTEEQKDSSVSYRKRVFLEDM